MAESNTLFFTCPDCGRELHIPEELEEFSCLYCGARHRRSLGPAVESTAARAAFDALCARLPGCVTGYPGVFRQLTAKAFPGCFESYREACREVFSLLPAALASGEDAGTRLAQALVDALEQACPGSSALDEAKYTMCLLMIPAIREEGLPGAEEFCRDLHGVWMRRHPKKPFQLTTYGEIAAGFQRRKLCFITTAVCSQEGKPDDCPELTAFRAFRDGWLAAQPEGNKLIETYYTYAPGIVTAIAYADCPREVYPAIREAYLSPCYRAIREGRMADCRDTYIQMVRTLGLRYLKRDLLS